MALHDEVWVDAVAEDQPIDAWFDDNTEAMLDETMSLELIQL